ncbi:MAG: hypothetical protein RIB70_08010 [Roseitalea porphyridii]|uniref:hypothetical protein n=1 Tax=Roseitalea porphyridii TaxID=1852022 RepID=UPI0032EC27F0
MLQRSYSKMAINTNVAFQRYPGQVAINRFVKEHNRKPKQFIWKAAPDEVIAAFRMGTKLRNQSASEWDIKGTLHPVLQ